MKKFVFLLLCSMYVLIMRAQESKRSLVPGVASYFDTVKAKSKDYFVLHYHEVSRERKKQMVYSDGKDIFNDSINKFSRMIIVKPYGEIDLPTIPLENIIILEDKGLIVGLTRIQASPYLLVIYDLDGKLLYKGNLGIYALRLTKGRLKELVSEYPNLSGCLEETNCFKDGDTCFVEYSRCIINTIGRVKAMDEIRNDLVWGRYASPFPISTDGPVYQPYENAYRYSDPIHEIVMIGSVPYLLTLNTEDSKQINIPLISNCNLKQWSQGK
jgi:hypothetical protein